MDPVSSRRLTGPNLMWDRPGAVLDIALAGPHLAPAIAAWQRQAARMLAALGWDEQQTTVRRYSNGASLAISAPIDALYAATEINEWAWQAAQRQLAGDPAPPFEPDAARLAALLAAEANPSLLALAAAAGQRRVAVLSDDDDVSLGLGQRSRQWPADALPAPGAIDWAGLGSVPVGLVTGTNGKTTSVRLAAHIAQAAGYVTGISSTDWIAVDGDIVERGDLSGPGGARTVLRDPRVEFAILETARGGLLRRGLAVTRADAVLITNVAADHLGEFGVETLDQLADVKWVVTRALGPGGRLVLNADDALLVERAERAPCPVDWFSLDPESPLITRHRARGGTAYSVIGGRLVRFAGSECQALLTVADVPITVHGAAIHNVANLLGVVGLMSALGIADAHIAAGAQSMSANANPGRCNVFDIGGTTAIVDFAHNPHGLDAFLRLARNLPSRRRLLVIGQAGDRSDADIRALARAATAAVSLDRIIIKAMAGYSRGRPVGETAEILQDEFARLGVPADAIERQDDELAAMQSALAWAEPGDLLLLLTHENRSAVLEFLNQHATASMGSAAQGHASGTG